MQLDSIYYDKTIDLEIGDLEILLDAYKNWCISNNIKDFECESIDEMIGDVRILDHVLYHAEIEINNHLDNPSYKIKSILDIFDENN